ncbi:MAG: H4MPT-linked C1 transfer pathway protein [Methylobacteriaceae bacterium]|nr:H4MPT-linked C1 transfer pathway protein [Methylobacteriaceae bacterium]
MSVVVGWDVGGAHLKGARAENGRIVAAVQIASPLWLGFARLDEAFAAARAVLGISEANLVTMTGELADAFASRAEGVAALAAKAVEALAPEPVSFYGGRVGLLQPADVGAHVADIASANWHASAALVARRCRDALFIDMGSTTTDIIPIAEGAIAARGYQDAERLASGELVYTGLVRSFVFAVARRAPFDGVRTPLMDEFFANMADVHRILGTLPDGVDQQATADGRDKSVGASRARLARTIGRDAADADDARWRALAGWFAEQQLRHIADAAMLVASTGRVRDDAPIVGAGIGVERLRELGRRLSRPFVAFDTLIEVEPSASAPAAHFAPAAALALLAGSPDRT